MKNKITINQINNILKKILENYEFKISDFVYEFNEKTNNENLVIVIHELFGDEAIIYLKLIFEVDNQMTILTKNEFLYLYDINCKYAIVKFDDIVDFENKLKNIIKNKKFGEDLLFLSDFIKKPTILIDEELKNNKVNNISVVNFYYEPKKAILPCEYIVFDFIMNIKNKKIEVNINKIKNNLYYLNFKYNKKTEYYELKSLKDELLVFIVMYIKNNFEQE